MIVSRCFAKIVKNVGRLDVVKGDAEYLSTLVREERFLLPKVSHGCAAPCSSLEIWWCRSRSF